MTIEDVGELLNKYNWILESESPLNVRSKDGEHHAQNFAAELTIEYFIALDSSDDDEEKESIIALFKPLS